jgi:hypothetical protein
MEKAVRGQVRGHAGSQPWTRFVMRLETQLMIRCHGSFVACEVEEVDESPAIRHVFDPKAVVRTWR